MKPAKTPNPAAASAPDNDDVSAALHLLGESLQGEVQRINTEGAQAMQKGDYDTAQAVIDFAKRLTAFRSKVDALGKEWGELEDLRDKASAEVQQIVSKRFFGRKSSGEITPTKTTASLFNRARRDGRQRQNQRRARPSWREDEGHPQTQRLRTSRVQRQTDPMAQHRPVGSKHNGQRRWTNENDSPNGIWEISAKGREWLKEDVGQFLLWVKREREPRARTHKNFPELRP